MQCFARTPALKLCMEFHRKVSVAQVMSLLCHGNVGSRTGGRNVHHPISLSGLARIKPLAAGMTIDSAAWAQSARLMTKSSCLLGIANREES